MAAVGLKKRPGVPATEQGPRSEWGWDPLLGRSSGLEGLARREAVSAGRGRSGRPGKQEPQGPEHHEIWVRARETWVWALETQILTSLPHS